MRDSTPTAIRRPLRAHAERHSALRLLCVAGAIVVAALGSVQRVSGATRVEGPLARVCVDSPLFAPGEPRFDGGITVVDPRGEKVWEKEAGRYDPFPLHATRTGIYRTVYASGRKRTTFKTEVFACPAGARVSLGANASPLLTMKNIGPGDAGVACVTVTYSDPNPGTMRLYSAAHASELAPYLDLVVTRGTADGRGPSHACRGFRPDADSYLGGGAGVVYKGTLADFPASYEAATDDPSRGDPRPWRRGERHAYRFAVSLRDDNKAQGLTASYAFVWSARTAPPSAIGVDSFASDGKHAALAVIGKTLRAIKKVAAEVGKRSAFPGFLLLLVGAFLAIQNRIDGRDPKLALAPIYPDAHLTFRVRLANGGFDA